MLLAGAWVCPLLHAGCAVAAVSAARAVWTGVGPLPAGLLVAASPVVGGYSALGQADHHTLVLLAALLALGAAVRAATRPGARGAAWWAGAFSGAGVWVSPEALLVAAPVLAGFGVLWVAEGARGLPGGGAEQGLRASLGFALVTAAGVAIEHPPAGWLDGEYDKVSAQHVLMGALGAAVFAAAGRVSGGVFRRAAAGGATALTAAGALLAVRPDALRSSTASMDVGAAELFMPGVAELRPLSLSLAGLFSETPAMLGAAPTALLALALAIPGWRREGKLAVAVPLGLALAVALPAALMHRRFAVDLAAPACLLAAGLPGLALGLRRPAPRAAAAFVAMAAVFETPFLSQIGASPGAESGERPGPEECGTAAVAALGQGREQGRERPEAPRGAADPVLFSNSINLGPELAWRTPFRLVGAPYHRGVEAIADTLAFFDATDDPPARAIAAQRQASMVLLCTPAPGEAPPGAASLLGRLRAGEAPEWLEPVPLPGAPAGVFLFAVRPAAAGAGAARPGG